MNWRKLVIYLFFWKDGTDILRYMREINTVQFYSRDKIQQLQEKELKDLLLHAYNNVPYYKEVFDSIELIQDGEVDLSRFSDIPILNKEIIREQKEQLYSKDKETRKWYKNTSGGSTGVPVEFIQDMTYRDKSWANKILYNRMLGKDEGQREVKLWGSERDIFQGSESLKARIQNWIYNRMLLNSFKMSEKQMGEYVKKINEFKPVSIWAYVDSAYELARYIEKNKLKVHSPTAILVTAGTVYPKIKKYISEVFQAPVYNQYGSREAGDMACECPEQNGLHVYEYLYKFEILDQKLQPCPPGEVGEIYVTLLMNYSMPLIRYKIGDTASWTGEESCACGRNLPLINDVHGRVTDHFKLEDGTLIHGEYFTHLFYFRPWIKKFQVVQEKYNVVHCYVVVQGEEDKKDTQDIIDKIQLVMGDACTVEIKRVEDIPPSKSGKYLYTKSNVE